MGNRNDRIEQTEFVRNDPLRKTDPVRVKHRKPSLQPSLRNSPNTNTPEQKPSFIRRLSNSFRSSNRKKVNLRPRVANDESLNGSHLASVIPQNVRRTNPALNSTSASLGCSSSNSFILREEKNVRRTNPGLNSTSTSLGVSRSNSFILHEEKSPASGYQEHQKTKETTAEQNFKHELLQKLASRPAWSGGVPQPSPGNNFTLREEYSDVKDIIKESGKSQPQLQKPSVSPSVKGSGFSSLPNSLVRKSRTETLAGSLPREQSPTKRIETPSDFHHFNRIRNESLRHNSRSNAGQPTLNASHSNPNTMENDLNRSQDSAKMHRRRSIDRMAVDVRGFGQGQPVQQRQMNIARAESVAIPKGQGALSGSPRGAEGVAMAKGQGASSVSPRGAEGVAIPKGQGSLSGSPRGAEGVAMVKGQGASSVSPRGSPKGNKFSPSHNENDGKKYFVAKDSWNGKNDLDVKQNEKLEYISTLADGSWYMRSCVTGSKGTLPSYILAPDDHIENQPWFFKSLGRRSAEEQLKMAGKHGTFLVRESESTPNDFSLSILDGDTVKHYRIRKHDTGGYFVELTYQFATLQDLVSFYSKEPRGLCSRLAIPCSKEIIRQERVTDEWELDRSLLEIRSVLGRGQFGVVREAILTIPGTNQRVRAAVKELKKGRNELAEFQKEVNALKTLRHERLIMLYGVCTKAEPYYIVTEFLKNKSLLDYIKGPEGRYLSLEEMLHIALQVAEGMAYLESQNYVHRDLAARNVLLDDRLNSKIADFGMVSKSMKGNNLAIADNEHERLPIKWTALEAIAEGKFTSKSDVWSFGILLTEIITLGVTPYKDMDNSEVLEFLVKGNRMAQPPCMDNQCYNITLECWAKNPDNRPSFKDLQVKLAKHIQVVKMSRNNNAFAPEYHG